MLGIVNELYIKFYVKFFFLIVFVMYIFEEEIGWVLIDMLIK